MAGVIDYASLKTEAALWLARSDLTARLDTFIQMAETQFNRELRTKQMDIIAVINTTGNALPLPADYLQARDVEIQGSPVQPLAFVTPDQRELYDLQASTGKPRLYSIRGGNLLLAPTPDQVYQVNFEYYQMIPTLVGGVNTTNWLITLWPDAYLYGVLVASTAYLMDDRLPQWVQALEKCKADVNRIDDDSAYAGSSVQMRPDVGW